MIIDNQLAPSDLEDDDLADFPPHDEDGKLITTRLELFEALPFGWHSFISDEDFQDILPQWRKAQELYAAAQETSDTQLYRQHQQIRSAVAKELAQRLMFRLSGWAIGAGYLITPEAWNETQANYFRTIDEFLASWR